MKKIVLLLIGIVLLQACKKDDPDTTKEFDKGALLTNLANNRIIPLISKLEQNILDLESAYASFQSSVSAADLVVVQEKWKTAYLTWQGLKVFDFGPIKDYGLKASFSTFPTDTTKINTNIANGSYLLSAVSNIDAIGFPALDYLLYKYDALNQFTTNPAYLQYVSELIQKMKTELEHVATAWSGYKAAFITSTGTETTSAFSLLVNEFNKDYELCKNAKLGIPIGKQSLGVQLPQYVEARYSGISFELMKANVNQLYLLFKGNSYPSGAVGTGFDDYLITLDKSTLNDNINTNFVGIINKINTFSGTLESEMTNSPSELDALYLLFQNQVVLIKTDMTSSFGVLITYQDNDGD